MDRDESQDGVMSAMNSCTHWPADGMAALGSWLLLVDPSGHTVLGIHAHMLDRIGAANDDQNPTLDLNSRSGDYWIACG